MSSLLFSKIWDTKFKACAEEEGKVRGPCSPTSSLDNLFFHRRWKRSTLLHAHRWLVLRVWGDAGCSSQSSILVCWEPAALSSPMAWKIWWFWPASCRGLLLLHSLFSLCLIAWSLPWKSICWILSTTTYAWLEPQYLTELCFQGCVILALLYFQNVCDLMQLPCGSWNTSIKTDKNKIQFDLFFQLESDFGKFNSIPKSAITKSCFISTLSPN